MKYQDMLNRFTEITNEYLNKGMTFSMTMHGVQGEKIKVDLTDGKSIFRIRIDSSYMYSLFDSSESFFIIVERFNTSNNERCDLWNGKGTEILRESYIHVGDKDSNYYVSFDEWCKIKDKKLARIKSSNIFGDRTDWGDEARKEIAIKYIKRQPRCKRKTVNDIDGISKYNNGEYVVFLKNGNVYTMNRKDV